MRIGVISNSRYLISDPNREWNLHSFTISPDTLSFSKIFPSAFATPARYVQEIFLRLYAIEESSQHTHKFIFNPLFDAGRLEILLVLGTLKKLALAQGVIVLTDRTGVPAGYFFPAWMKSEDSHFLTLLSTVNGKMDADLLSKAYFTEVECVQVAHLYLGRAGNNNFLYNENKGVYIWVAEKAIGVLTSRLTSISLGGCDRVEARRLRNSIPFTAVMPHHAGDVLFFALAFNRTQSHVTRLAVNIAYRDIVVDIAPKLDVFAIDAPLINRDNAFRQGKVMPESAYFNTFKDSLQDDGFYYYCRPSRDYNVSMFHLIDHYAFALGSQCCTSDKLPSMHRPTSSVFSPNIPNDPPKILLHFDGGWPLKVYPKSSQEQMIDLLHTKGYDVTVLSGKEHSHPKCQVTIFKSYDQFKLLVKSHHLLVGMDSFPTHFAAHVLGLPTICLFASTRPENSNAPAAANYLYLEKGLRCRPCYGIVKCPLYGNDYCDNFVSPETVVSEIDRMLRVVRQHGSSRNEAVLPTSGKQEKCLPSPNDVITYQVRTINLRYLRAKVLLAALAGLFMPPLFFVLTIQREFTASLQREGLLSTYLRTLRFLRRAFRRNSP
jgi:hypothetical protein